MANKRRTKKVATTFAFALGLVFSSSGQSATVLWDSPNSGDWSNGANWNIGDGGIPAAGDDVIIQNLGEANSLTVNYNVNLLAPGLNSLFVGSRTILDQQQNTLITNSLSVSGSTGGIYTLGGTGNLNVINNTTLGGGWYRYL